MSHPYLDDFVCWVMRERVRTERYRCVFARQATYSIEEAIRDVTSFFRREAEGLGAERIAILRRIGNGDLRLVEDDKPHWYNRFTWIGEGDELVLNQAGRVLIYLVENVLVNN